MGPTNLSLDLFCPDIFSMLMTLLCLIGVTLAIGIALIT